MEFMQRNKESEIQQKLRKIPTYELFFYHNVYILLMKPRLRRGSVRTSRHYLSNALWYTIKFRPISLELFTFLRWGHNYYCQGLINCSCIAMQLLTAFHLNSYDNLAFYISRVSKTR